MRFHFVIRLVRTKRILIDIVWRFVRRAQNESGTQGFVSFCAPLKGGAHKTKRNKPGVRACAADQTNHQTKRENPGRVPADLGARPATLAHVAKVARGTSGGTPSAPLAHGPAWAATARGGQLWVSGQGGSMANGSFPALRRSQRPREQPPIPTEFVCAVRPSPIAWDNVVHRRRVIINRAVIPLHANRVQPAGCRIRDFQLQDRTGYVRCRPANLGVVHGNAHPDVEIIGRPLALAKRGINGLTQRPFQFCIPERAADLIPIERRELRERAQARVRLGVLVEGLAVSPALGIHRITPHLMRGSRHGLYRGRRCHRRVALAGHDPQCTAHRSQSTTRHPLQGGSIHESRTSLAR